MSEETARKVANVLLGVAVAGAAYYVLKTPPLRRMAGRMAVTALTVTLPAWLSAEVRDAWRSAAEQPPQEGRTRDMMTA